MSNIRISVSDLEAIRYWENSEDADLDKLLTDLRHEGAPNKFMLAGRAWAECMEHSTDGGHATLERLGYTFHFDVDCALTLPPVREAKLTAVIETPSGTVTLVGKCDGYDGTTVYDQKLTEKPDPEKYTDSLQWRVYLMMFKARRFQYDVFECKRYSDEDRDITIVGYHPFTCYAYEGMERDVHNAVIRAAEIIKTYLPERVKP
jgi:hypothetical protein